MYTLYDDYEESDESDDSEMTWKDYLLLIFISIVALYVCIFMYLKIIPDRGYMIYTHSKGWIHSSKATKQDFKEISGVGPAPLDLD